MVEVLPNSVVVLPAEVREQYHIRGGDRLRLVDIDGVFILAQQKASTLAQVNNSVKTLKRDSTF